MGPLQSSAMGRYLGDMTNRVSLLVVDQVNIAYRCYSVMDPMIGATGIPVHAVKGFFGMVRRIIEEFRPEKVIVCCEGFRNPRKDAFAGYKAHRAPMPSEFTAQLPLIEDLCRAAGWVVFRPEVGEADDAIASVVAQVPLRPALLFTSDKDARSLISADVRLVRREKQQTLVTGAADLLERYGVTPSQWTDFLSLTGDSADGIPGVEGIGEGKAAKLLQQFGSADAMFARLGEAPPALRKHIEAGRDAFALSRKLVRMDSSIPVPATFPTPNPEKFQQIAEVLGLRMSFPSLGTTPSQAGSSVPAPVAREVQTTLF